MSAQNSTEYTNLAEYSQGAYLEYAMSVVRGRALPDVEDGQKAVHRRILWSMHKLGLDHTARYTKSARVVGECIGKYHPHGDSSVYEAMVRMSQSFSLRYPLVDGQGNFGTRGGDSAAAMRYTEARLTPIANALLDELAWDTIDYRPNFDGQLKEPDTLPARLPFLLLNGASGIGVGLACEIPPHRLEEVVEAAKLILTRKKVTLEEVLEKMPGPDFPTGAQLIDSPADIQKVYEEGRGAFTLRARWHVVEQAKNRWHLHFYELPQTTSVDAVILQLVELMNPTPKTKNNKKLPLDPEQLRKKKLFSDLIEEIQDVSEAKESGKTEWGMVIIPKDRKMAPEVLARTLCAYTSLESRVPVNLTAVDTEVVPRRSFLVDWLAQWCSYRVETARRRLTDEKDALDRRLHIIEGRLSILDKIQEVIRLLQQSDNPKQDLMDKYKLSEIQAEDVLEMRLRQLANLEKVKLEDEEKKKRAEQERLAKILGDDKLLRKWVVQELDADVKRYGANDPRRTLLQPDQALDAKDLIKTAVADKMAPEPVAVALTERGWISWRPAKSWEEARATDFKVRTGDSVRRIFFGDRADQLLLMDEAGKGYSLALRDLSSKADTQPLSNWFDAGARICEGALSSAEGHFLLAGDQGYGFIVKASDWMGRMKAGKALLTLKPGELPLAPLPLSTTLPADGKILAWSTDGRAVAFPLTDVSQLPKGKGVGLIGLAGDAKLADVVLIPEDGKVTLKTPQGWATVGPSAWEGLLGARSSGKKGKVLHQVRNKPILGSVFDRPGREEPQPASPAASE